MSCCYPLTCPIRCKWHERLITLVLLMQCVSGYVSVIPLDSDVWKVGIDRWSRYEMSLISDVRCITRRLISIAGEYFSVHAENFRRVLVPVVFHVSIRRNINCHAARAIFHGLGGCR